MTDEERRKEDILAVAKAFRQVLTDNFAGDFPRVVETLQLATAMAIVDLKNDGKITDEGIKKFFIIRRERKTPAFRPGDMSEP